MNTTTAPTVRPGQQGYDEARLGFQTHGPQTPAAVVVATGADDVTAAVLLARCEGRRVAVQSTGHGVGAVDHDAVLVSTTGLDELTVDPATRTARVGAGVRWGAVVDAAAEHGLAPLSGSSPGVGVAGYLVSGGVALLGRAHGWAADHVRAFEVVLADGTQRRVGPGDELFWALRGGGGSFAIVTAVEIGLIELTTVHGGTLFLPADSPDATAAVLRGWRDWAAELPDSASTSVAIIPFPDVDGPPPPVRGRTVAAVRVIVEGSAAGAGRRVAPLRALAAPLLDGLRELPWTESHTIHSDPTEPAASSGTTVALSALPDDAIDAAVATQAVPGARRVAEIRRMGGAFSRPVEGSGPVRRDAEWSAGTVTILATGGPDIDATAERGAEHDAAFRAALAPVTVGRLANFLFGEGADPAAVAAAYSDGDLARLRELRRELDPEGRLLASAPIEA